MNFVYSSSIGLDLADGSLFQLAPVMCYSYDAPGCVSYQEVHPFGRLFQHVQVKAPS